MEKAKTTQIQSIVFSISNRKRSSHSFKKLKILSFKIQSHVLLLTFWIIYVPNKLGKSLSDSLFITSVQETHSLLIWSKRKLSWEGQTGDNTQKLITTFILIMCQLILVLNTENCFLIWMSVLLHIMTFSPSNNWSNSKTIHLTCKKMHSKINLPKWLFNLP